MDGDIKKLIEEQGKAFDEYKKNTEAQLAELKKGNLSADSQQKMDAILKDYDSRKDAMDKLYEELQLAKSNGSLGSEGVREDKELKDAFNAYLRKGRKDQLENVLKSRQNALSSDSDPDGGYTVSPTLSSRIVTLVGVANHMRQVADIQTISSGDTFKLINDPNDISASPVGEKDTRAETGTPQIGATEIKVCEYFTFPKATQNLLDDSSWNIEAWLAGKASRAFNNVEAADFFTGNSPLRARGLLTYDTVADASWAFGKIGFVTTGQAAALSGTGAELIDVIDVLKDEYHPNANFFMKQSTLTTLRKTRAGASGANQFLLWQPSLVPGQPDSILGYPVRKVAAMPAVGADVFPIAFGDFRQAYTIVDRQDIRVLRDSLTAKPYVGFYTTKRVGGGVVNFEAVKFVKVSA